jgi:type II secretory pathway pseudopilin PulG
MRKGFTILELLVIISVLIILIGIAIPKFKELEDRSRIAQAKSELQTLKVLLEANYSHQFAKAYPPSSPTIASSLLIKVNPQIVSSVPYDPFGPTLTTEYNYYASSNGHYYVIYSVGTNGVGGIKGISNSGKVLGKDADDICVTNGTGC